MFDFQNEWRNPFKSKILTDLKQSFELINLFEFITTRK
jgi:hypothetical protein